MLNLNIESDKKLSKQMIIDLCNSGEFNEFKEMLKSLNNGIDKYELETIISSIIAIGKSSDLLLSKLNSSLKYRIEKYLTTEQVGQIEMVTNGNSISLVYKQYVPSYIKNGVYTSVENELIVVDFTKKSVLMKDIVTSYEEAENYSLSEMKDIKRSLEIRKIEIAEMEAKRDVKSFVMEKVKQVVPDSDISKPTEKLRIFLDKNAFFKYQIAYDELLVEMKEEFAIRSEDFAKTKSFDYETRLLEVRELQKGIMRRLVGLNFNMEFERKDQYMELKRNPLELLKMYSK